VSPITTQQAWDATDPSQSPEQREAAAKGVLQSVAANDAYWASRSELERLKALALGEQVVAHADINPGNPTAGEVPTADADGTVVEGSEQNSIGAASDGESTDTDNMAADKLRKQLTDAGMTPEA
jgi:hypothetical protein